MGKCCKNGAQNDSFWRGPGWINEPRFSSQIRRRLVFCEHCFFFKKMKKGTTFTKHWQGLYKTHHRPLLRVFFCLNFCCFSRFWTTAPRNREKGAKVSTLTKQWQALYKTQHRPIWGVQSGPEGGCGASKAVSRIDPCSVFCSFSRSWFVDTSREEQKNAKITQKRNNNVFG